ncbi:MAG: YraN family protein [Ruminococcus sp.]|nr:YraN family protein [Ruminococcus sp.]MCM1380887.1 YraN family protein [Muribaculaceae bacterium]MCM1478583.1 YraN family protein [Muribaculaceae bacterium]
MDKKELGYFGENAAVWYLEKNGYRILRRNFTVRGGEIDIIAEKDGIIAFVEVKTRAPEPLVNGFEAVTKSKQRLIIKASEEYSYRFPHDLQPRFDVAWVTVTGRKVVDFRYIENAFDASR